MSVPCPFCEIARVGANEDLVAYRTEHVFVVPTLKQRATNPGQVVVCPVSHETRLEALPRSLRDDLFSVTQRVAQAAPVAFSAVGTTLMLNQGAPDQIVHHLHFHVIPRFLEDNLTIPNPDQSAAPRLLRLELATQLRAALLTLPHA